MSRPAAGDSGMSRLDVAKMVVEDLSRQLKKRQGEHARLLTQGADPVIQRSIVNLGQKGNLAVGDAFLLLSTSRQYPDTATCGAGGRLLVGFGSSGEQAEVAIEGGAQQQQQQQQLHQQQQQQQQQQQHEIMESFQRELKGLVAARWEEGTPFPEDAGGAVGLNAALSSGLQLLSRFRLQNHQTENYGMGRLPNTALVTANGTPAAAALQPACLVLLTDGACLRQPPKLGGGSLQLQFGSQPLREFYTEPFRWDQRIFCLGVGGREGVTSSQYLHPQLRALCEVTGGSHWMVRGALQLTSVTESLVKRIRPPLPRELPLPDPLGARTNPSSNIINIPKLKVPPPVKPPVGSCFVNGGPVCCFQSLEMDEGSRAPAKMRAMMLYTGSTVNMQPQSPAPDAPCFIGSPLWCIPEAYFPSKKLDTLPPRKAQPLLFFSKYPANLASKSFEPNQVIKMLQRLDHLITSNRKFTGQPARLLHRDVYVCEWLSQEGGKAVQVSVNARHEFFPVFIRGGGRPSLSEEADSLLNIGILHVPAGSSTMAAQSGPSRLATLTLLPPEPHILLPLLLRMAELEHRALKKAETVLTKQGNTNPALLQKQIAAKALVSIDEPFRNEFRAYLFRLPPYYQFNLKRTLRSVLPTAAHSVLPGETLEVVTLQCFSKTCMQKIRNSEQMARDMNERLERQELALREKNLFVEQEKPPPLRYGQYDPRGTLDSYLAALRSMPPPWQVPNSGNSNSNHQVDDKKGQDRKEANAKTQVSSPKSVLDVLGDLPGSCLMAYYESRRRWIFGGPSLSTRGLHVEGVNNGGSNSQRCGRTSSDTEECPLSLAGIGVSTLNKTTTTKMGDYRERLLFSRSPVVGYGSNDAAGVAATTAADGSPRWSVDDDAMPIAFFNTRTGEFADSVQARVRSKLMVNFGNPYKEKRADSLIPEKYHAQAPSMQQGGIGSLVGGVTAPDGSPPHDSFDSVEEGEAIFVRKSPSRLSPKREEPEDPEPPSSQSAKVARTEQTASAGKAARLAEAKPPPPKPASTPTKVPPAGRTAPLSPVPSSPARPSTPTPPEGTKVTTPKGTPSKPPPPKAGSVKKLPPPPRPPPPKPPGAAPRRNSLRAPPPPAPPRQPKAPGRGTAPTKPQPPKEPSSSSKSETSFASLPSEAPNNLLSQQRPSSKDLDSYSSIGPPTMTRSESEASIGARSRPPPPPGPSLDLVNPDVKPSVDLPPGWICSWSKSQRRWYFFDTRSNKSVWNWPPA